VDQTTTFTGDSLTGSSYGDSKITQVRESDILAQDLRVKRDDPTITELPATVLGFATPAPSIQGGAISAGRAENGVRVVR
jgi:hypothetical protein